MLRTGVLTGRTIALAPGDAALAAALERLGAAVTAPNAEAAPPPGVGSALDAPTARPDTLVVDARGPFAAAGGGYPGLRSALDLAFSTARETALAHWIDRPGGGQVVLLAPAPAAGAHAEAARAGLENLVRTLGTEWARHQVTTVAVLPGDATTETALADLVGWLASPAGAYLSGTALTLDRPR